MNSADKSGILEGGVNEKGKPPKAISIKDDHNNYEEKEQRKDIISELMKAVKELIKENRTMWDEIKELKKELFERDKEEISEIKEDIHRLEKKAKKEREERRKERESLKTHLKDEVRKECSKIMAEIGNKNEKRKGESDDKDMRLLKEYVQRQAKWEKKTNIIVKGLALKEQDTKREMEQFIREKVQVKYELLWAKKIGKGEKGLIVAKVDT
ncbi:PREDICTED: ribonuclease Y-like [Eufriesea mexicana]|uniref:ribonuclease Y-like n=1 Tax=Eufriesea mexicana TaxID=516756 RepID=UPI00083C66ED|nr:PREDICTED: ribonuclease Y-like [Eufriesea mexicana]